MYPIYFYVLHINYVLSIPHIRYIPFIPPTTPNIQHDLANKILWPRVLLQIMLTVIAVYIKIP